MRLTEFLQAEDVKVPLTATGKEAAIYELVDLLADHGAVSDRAGFKAAVWQRESMRTTGIGHGVAIPHGKNAGCVRLCLAVGRPAQPLDFGSVDGKPVDLIFLLGSPPDQTGPHIQALANISRMLSDSGMRQAIRTAMSAADLYKLIVAHEMTVPA
jgi:fructose-specific phosphotransferase system IIA component